METIKGDLLELAQKGEFFAIIHGCNCFHNMGGGIAAQIARKYPMAMAVDIISTVNGDKTKLGNFTTSLITSEHHSPFVIINAYTQYEGGSNVDYEAIMRVMGQINKNFQGKRIAFPAIGAGIAGGNWELISAIIKETLKDVDAVYVEYESPFPVINK